MYDRYQFEGPRQAFGQRAAEFGVSSKELAESMRQGSSGGRTTRWIPEYATNDAQLRSVLVHATISYVFHSKRVPADIQTDLAHLKRMADDRLAYWQSLANGSDTEWWNKVAERLRSIADAGGYMALIAAISYRAWRLRWHDKEIERELNLKQWTVRDLLLRLNRIAYRLGYPACKPRPDFFNLEVLGSCVATMWENKAPVGLIAEILSIQPEMVRRLLRKHGLYVFRGRSARRLQTHCRKCGTALVQTKRQQMCPACDRAKHLQYGRERRRKHADEKFIKTVAWG